MKTGQMQPNIPIYYFGWLIYRKYDAKYMKSILSYKKISKDNA